MKIWAVVTLRLVLKGPLPARKRVGGVDQNIGNGGCSPVPRGFMDVPAQRGDLSASAIPATRVTRTVSSMNCSTTSVPRCASFSGTPCVP